MALQAAEKLCTMQEDVPQGLKPDVFSTVYGTTKQDAEKLEIGRKAYLRG